MPIWLQAGLWGLLSGGALVLGAAVLLWVAGFDILYALQDEHFDREAGLHSLPVRLGRARAMALAKCLHSGAGLCFFLVGWLAGLGWLYFLAVVAAGLLLWWEHRLLSPQDLSRLNQAFFTLNGSLSLVLGAATLFSFWP